MKTTSQWNYLLYLAVLLVVACGQIAEVSEPVQPESETNMIEERQSQVQQLSVGKLITRKEERPSGEKLAGCNGASSPPEVDPFKLAENYGKVSTEMKQSFQRTRKEPPSVYGQLKEFYVTDIAQNHTYSIQARLERITPHAYWYFDENEAFSKEALESVAKVFENEIQPQATKYFGDVWNPGIDNDSRITILNTDLRGGVAGYFGSHDELPRYINPYSNEREMLYMNTGSLHADGKNYQSILAHELQHAIHWNSDASEDAWVNEGMSEVLVALLGYGSYFEREFLNNPDIQLNYWPSSVEFTAPHYGASALFFQFLTHHYGGKEALKEILLEKEDGIRGICEFLKPFNKSFAEVFADWVIANYIGAGDGQYSYGDRRVKITTDVPIFADFDRKDKLPQFSAKYYKVWPDNFPNDIELEFKGSVTVNQVSTECDNSNTCLWSGLGDSIDSSVIYEFDLSGMDLAVLEFRTWYKIEEDWDYAYVSVSDDAGLSWDVLEGTTSTRTNPVGNNLAVGYTGESGGWIKESIDLSPYTGGRIQIRFQYVTDAAVNLDGFLIDDVIIREVDILLDEHKDETYKSAFKSVGKEIISKEGFRPLVVPLYQKFIVQLIEENLDGTSNIYSVPLREDMSGRMIIKGHENRIKNIVIVVSPVTENTYQEATYQLSVKGYEN